MVEDLIIVGGGQSGLATAYYLQKMGITPLILDNEDAAGGSWQHVWPSMTLFSSSDFSNLPGRPMPHHEGFPTKAQVVDYLVSYEERYGFTVERPVHVDSVDFVDGIFHVRAGERTWQARTVVAATGTWRAPFVPAYPGTFAGKQWHCATYPGPDCFAGSTVAVVGAGNSGAQIAAELTDVASVTWYTRHEPRWMPDDVDGRVLFNRSRERILAIKRGEPDPGADEFIGDIVMLPKVKAARDSGALQATGMFTSLSEVQADQLIWCTGFRPALGPFRKLMDHEHPKVAGLHLVGYGNWVSPGAATIVGVAPNAKEVAERIRDELHTTALHGAT